LGDLRNTKEYLFIGSPTSLMCFGIKKLFIKKLKKYIDYHKNNSDVMSNKTIFDKDVNDGVYCTTTGIFSKFNQPLCFVGGNCSLQVKYNFSIYYIFIK